MCRNQHLEAHSDGIMVASTFKLDCREFKWYKSGEVVAACGKVIGEGCTSLTEAIGIARNYLESLTTIE